MQIVVTNIMKNSEIIGKNDMAKHPDFLKKMDVFEEKGKSNKNENIQFVGKKGNRQRKTDSFL